MNWISAEEKLPEVSKTYDDVTVIIVYEDDFGIKRVMPARYASTTVRRVPVKRWVRMDYKIIRSKVTHWMPLPDPPK